MGETITILNRLFSRRREKAWWWSKKISVWGAVVAILTALTILYVIMQARHVMADEEVRK